MAALTRGHEDNFELCSFNSGNAMHKPVCRNHDSFQKISGYPLIERKQKYGIEGAASEMSIRRRHIDVVGALVDTIAL